MQNLIFSLKIRKKMSFDDKEFRRVILNYGVEFEHEENFCLFICIFKIGTIETVELMFNFVEKNWEKICYQHLITEELCFVSEKMKILL